MTNRQPGRITRPGLLGILGLAASLAGQPAWAQDDGKDKQKAPPDPMPAEMAPLANRDLLLDVAAVPDGGYIAVGARGHIVRSADGIHWDQAETPVQATLTAVAFADAEHGWAVGHAATILATDDGGQTWSIQHFDPGLETPFLDVAFVDDQKGFAIGAYDLFYKTDDGGKSWTEFEPQLSRGGWHLNGIISLDDGTLVVAGETGLLSKSTDGGKTWQLLDAPYSGTFFGLRQLGAQGVLLYGLRGHAFVVDDIGAVSTLPSDTDLGYQFKVPPTMEKKAEKDKATSKEEARAEAERKAARKKAAKSEWQVVGNRESVLSLFGATTTENGGYVLVGVNGVIWASDNNDAQTTMLPNSREGSLADVVATPDGNLVVVGTNGAFYYKRSN